MRKNVIAILLLLIAGTIFAESNTPRWHKTTNVTVAATVTAKFDSTNGGSGVETTTAYFHWRFCNIVETTDTVWFDLNVHSGTQNTAVNDGSRSTSVPVRPGSCKTVDLKYQRSTASVICDAAQTCSNVDIDAWN